MKRGDTLSIELNKPCVKITYPNKDVVIIDREDLKLFASHAWFPVSKNGNTKYLIRNTKRSTERFHTRIMNTPPGMEIDHLNGNGLDNRKHNLRVVTHLENQNNMKTINRKKSSKYRYVSFCKARQMWFAYVRYNNKTVNLGRFCSEKQAAIAANNFILTNKLPKILNVIE